MARGTLGTGMMAPLSMANNFNGPYYAGPSGAAMGALMASQAIADGFRDWGESKGRQQEEARVKAEKDRLRMEEMNQRRAVAQALNPAGYVEQYGDMGNRPTNVAPLPDAGTQMSLYNVVEAKRKEAQAQELEKKKNFANAYFAQGGHKVDPTGEKFAARFGYNPYEIGSTEIIARMEEKEAQRQWQEQMKREGWTQAQILAGMRGGEGNVGTWSLTPDGRARMNNKTGEIVPLGETYAKPNAAGGNPFDKEFGKKAAQDYFKLQDSAEKAQMSMTGLKAAEDAINRGIYTGIGGEAAQTGRKILGSMGMANADDVAAAEEITKLQNEMALIIRNPDSGMGLPGAASDRDVAFLRSMQFGLDKSPTANRKFIEAARRVKQRQIEIADAASKFIQENGTLDQNFYSQLRSFSQANPMFADMEEAPSPQAGGGTRQKVGPRPGTVVDGYEYLGGDPNDQRSWRPANGK